MVVLGLDASKFTQEQRDAMDAFRRTQEQFDRSGKAMEASSAKVADSFGIIRKGAMGIIGAFVGGEIAGFIEHVVTMDAATGRWARTMDASVENLGTWQSMIRQVGGTAEDATSALSTMQNELNNVRQGGGLFSEGFGYLLNKIGGAQGKSADQIMRELNSYFRGEIAAGRETPGSAATYLRRIPGMNEPMIQALLGDLGKLEAESKKVGTATKETAEAAQLLTQRFSLLTQALERLAARLIPFIDLLAKPFNEITGKDLSRVFGGMAPRAERGGVIPDAGVDWLNSSSLWDQLTGQRLRPLGGGGGGTRGDRNNNPGNIKDGPFARAHGATGSDGSFAVFPDFATGSAAQEALVRGSAYRGLTLDEFARKYAEGNPAWESTVGSMLGVRGGDIVNNQDPRLIDAIRRAEGTGARSAAASRAGVGRSSSSTITSTTNIGKVEVHTQATDAEGIAADIGPAIKHSAITAPANTGLL